MKESKLIFYWCVCVLLALFALFWIVSCSGEKEEAGPTPLEIDEPIYDIPLVKEEYIPVFQQAEFIEYGYEDMAAWFNDMKIKNADAMGVSDSLIEMFADVITDEQIAGFREYEEIMTTTLSIDEYNKASEAFDAIFYECDAALSAYLAPKYAQPNSGYSGGGFDIPYNFRQMGVLNDSDYRYTYYSSNVLYHYRTPEWTLGSDGIYRDSAGRVVVASDAYPEGTVVQSELFGECIVLDCGVGRTDTLDVYVGW